MENNNQNHELLYQKQIARSLQDQQYNSVKVIRQAVRLRSIKYWVQSGLYTGIYQLWQPHIFFVSSRPDQTRPGSKQRFVFHCSQVSSLYCGPENGK